MRKLASRLNRHEAQLMEATPLLEACGFGLGGNWDYDHGCFDRALDEAQKVWLRLPFTVINGQLDNGTGNSDTRIQFGQPFVLRHLYNEGLDPEADVKTLGSLIDQFQDPVDPDAPVSNEWMNKAETALAEAERTMLAP